MFSSLSDRLNQTIRNLRGQGRLTEKNIQDALKEVRKALIEADVAISVVKSFLANVKKRAVGHEVMSSITPGQAMIKIVNEELTQLMGDAHEPINLKAQPPVVILIAGLQGSGKTTTTAKLAQLLKQQQKKNVMVASADIYRPAAIEQLKTLAEQTGINFFPSTGNDKPKQIAKDAVQAAKQQAIDVLLLDTAGRLHVDDEMMAEIKAVHKVCEPTETLFVVDSMTGQDAANTAKAFDAALPLTGVILTKIDGDTRGGAALSVRMITDKPIKYLGTGEKMDGIEPFHPERMASRILGMGDVLSLIEEAEQKVDRAKAEKLAKKFQKGQAFDLEDYRDQILEMNKMGGVQGMLAKLPGGMNIPEAAKSQIDDSVFNQTIAIINSMTVEERRHPNVINNSRKQRISRGSGTQVPDVNRLLKQFDRMQKMMKKMRKPGAMKAMMRQMGGKMPPNELT